MSRMSKYIQTLVLTFTFYLLVIMGTATAQVNFMGKPGMGIIPKPDSGESKEKIWVGYSRIPKMYAKNNFMNRLSDENYFFIGFNATDWLRVNAVLTRPQGIERIGIGDRHLDLQFRLLKEKGILPNVSVTLTPLIGSSNFIEHNTLILSKNFLINSKFKIEPVIGYGLKKMFTKPIEGRGLSTEKYGWFDRKAYGNEYLYGFFGGIQASFDETFFISAEYDSKYLNFTAGTFIKKRIFLQATYMDLNQLSITLSYRIKIVGPPYDIKRYAKKH